MAHSAPSLLSTSIRFNEPPDQITSVPLTDWATRGHAAWVGLFRRRVELVAANVDDDWSAGDDWHAWEAPRNLIRGESHYQATLQRLAGGKPRRNGYLIPVSVSFVRDPKNEHDRNAFRAQVDGELVGHLARDAAAQLARTADRARCTSFAVCGVLRGGSLDARHLGVHVWVDRRLSPGVETNFADDEDEVSWPPFENEGAHCSADDAG